MAVTELVATATTVAESVAKDVLYFSAWWHGDPAVAVAVATAVATNSDTALCAM